MAVGEDAPLIQLTNWTSCVSRGNVSASDPVSQWADPAELNGANIVVRPSRNCWERSYANQMAMALLCTFLAAALITQFVMYFLIVEKSSPYEDLVRV